MLVYCLCTTCSQGTTVKDTPHVDALSFSLHCFTCVSILSERIQATKDIPYTTSTQCTIIESMAVADCLHALKPVSNDLLDDATLAAMVSEDELTHLAEVFAAMLDYLDNEHPNDPSMYSKAMASPDAAAWTTTLQEEFSSLQDLGIFKFIPYTPWL